MSTPPNDNDPNPKNRNLMIGAFAAAAIFGLAVMNGADNNPNKDLLSDFDNQQPGRVTYSQFVESANSRQSDKILINGGKAVARLKNGKVIYTDIPPNENLADRVWNSGVQIESVAPPPPPQPNFLLSLLGSMLPIALIVGVWWFMLRPMMGGGKGGVGGMAKSKAKLLTSYADRVTFKDVAGIEEAKDDLTEIVDFLRNPGKYARLGGKIPRGCLLVGPPGTGKTLTARAVAGEAGVPFFSVAGSEFVEMYVGMGAARVRDMFAEARKNAPCIIFIDEIDAVGRARGSGGAGNGNEEREQTLNQILVEMDGFSANQGIILIAATNRPDVLDKALMRPGRFDRQVTVPLPDVLGREKILGVHTRRTPLANDVDLRVVARGTPGFSGADLANLVNEAALRAARNNKQRITMQDFEASKDKIMMGAERKTYIMSDKERAITAYHEAGHAIVAIHSENSDPVHKATIVPRGRSLGMVMRLPDGDRVSMSLAKLMDELAVGMGGRAAEEITFGDDHVTTGASSDIQMVTNIARQMVTEWGLSKKVGPIRYASNDQQDFLGGGSGRMQVASGDKAQIIEDEIKRLVDEGHQRARQIIEDHKQEYEILAQGLLKYETLSGAQIKALLRGEEPVFEEAEILVPEAPAAPVRKPAQPKREFGVDKRAQYADTPRAPGNSPIPKVPRKDGPSVG